MDYTAATNALVAHQPRHRPRLLRRLLIERCATCAQPYPCAGRREARQAILDTLNRAHRP